MSAGFYKEENGTLIWSADKVVNEDYQLWSDIKDSYEYPVKGWHWFDSEFDARQVLKCIGSQPFPSWVTNEHTGRWEAPNLDGIIVPVTKDYLWDEDSLKWLEVEVSN